MIPIKHIFTPTNKQTTRYHRLHNVIIPEEQTCDTETSQKINQSRGSACQLTWTQM